MLVTLRVRPEWNLTEHERLIAEVISTASGRFGCTIAVHGLERQTLRLTVCAAHRRVLTCAMQGFSIRLARALNGARSRAGKVFADRYEARTSLEAGRGHGALNERIDDLLPPM